MHAKDEGTQPRAAIEEHSLILVHDK